MGGVPPRPSNQTYPGSQAALCVASSNAHGGSGSCAIKLLRDTRPGRCFESRGAVLNSQYNTGLLDPKKSPRPALTGRGRRNLPVGPPVRPICTPSPYEQLHHPSRGIRIRGGLGAMALFAMRVVLLSISGALLLLWSFRFRFRFIDNGRTTRSLARRRGTGSQWTDRQNKNIRTSTAAALLL